MAPLILLLATVCSIAQGQSVYNYYTEICCNGTVYKKPMVQGYYYECCGNKPLLKSNKYEVDEFCCGNTVLSKDKGLACCDGSPYDRKISDCHDNTTVVDIPEADLKAGNTHACGVSFDDVKFYNATTHLCCKGNIRKKESPLHFCCGKEVHDSSTTACCGGAAIPRETGSVMDCCGQNLYNPNTQICCQHNVFDNPEEPLDNDVNEKYTFQQRRFLASRRRRQYTYDDCCGAELYNRTSQKCCRHSTINAEGVEEKQTGLHNLVAGKNQHTMQCCGTNLYDSNTHVCEDHEDVYRRGDTITRHCCQKTYEYEVNRWQWRHVEKQSGVEDDDWCLQKRSWIEVHLYDVGMTEMCYKNTWGKYNTSLNPCLINGQFESYDFSNQVCCPTGVVDMPKEEGYEQDPFPPWQCCEIQ